MCISDFIAPAGSGINDYIGVFAVSTGFGCQELCDQLVVYSSILLVYYYHIIIQYIIQYITQYIYCLGLNHSSMITM